MPAEAGRCKICGSEALQLRIHTARCSECGVLLFYPYPDDSVLAPPQAPEESRRKYRSWYERSSFFNHTVFTNAVRFAGSEALKEHKISVLDYGGGGGQFALVFKSHFFDADVYLVDLDDNGLLEEWSPLNRQIPFSKFAEDATRFEIIFLNDAFEHLSEPTETLKLLASKLTPDGRIFLDTPRQFWIYPVLRRLPHRRLYDKLLRGTVTKSHLQIWSDRAFEHIVADCGLAIERLERDSEFSMPPDFYLQNMNISNPILRSAGRLFYRSAKYLARNKIRCILSPR